MSGPLQAAGATSEPSEYAPIGMDRAITGLWTQRSELRDAAVPYLQAKYYSASRFDSLIDGLNCEISARLTTVRRPGVSVYNSAAWSKISSFYSFSWIAETLFFGQVLPGSEHVQVIAEELDNPTRVYDATGPSTRQLLFTSSSAPGGFTRFASVNNALYFMNGVDAEKYLQPGKVWAANRSFSIGDYIRDTNGNIQEVSAVSVTALIANIQVLAILGVTYVRVGLHDATPFSPGLGATPTLTFGGLSSATFLNGQTIGNITTYAADALQVQPFAHAAYGPAVDTGAVTGLTSEAGQSALSGGGPAWNAALGGSTTDGAVIWINRGLGVYPQGVISPTIAPKVIPGSLGDNRFWQPNTFLASQYSIIDSNGNLQISNGGATGPIVPIWNTSDLGGTFDGTVTWTNFGKLGAWSANTAFTGPVNLGLQIVLDSNGNIQLVTAGGTSGGSTPAWNATIGGSTTDGTVTWRNLGPGVMLRTAGLGYAYAYRALDGSIGNASPVTSIIGAVLGSAAAGYQVAVSGPGPGSDSQYTGIVIYRILQGGSILLQLDIIPNTGTSSWSYLDTLPDAALDEFLTAPINNQNNPPPAGATVPCEHLQRLFVAVGATLYYSTGPDTNSGSNGYTAWNPSNNIRFKSAITRFDSVTLNTGPALMVWTTSYVGLVIGQGTTQSPFLPATFMPDVGLLHYNAVCPIGSTFYLLDNHLKAVSLDPSAGYAEIGFPIGDQFLRTTTGGLDNQIFSPLTAYVTWYEGSSGDSGLYYCDGQNGWFRYSPVSSPESGFLWSPLARIEVGTSAVQSVRVGTGQSPDQLLLGPPGSSGPILMRDTSTHADVGNPYSDCYVTMGNIQLCESGEIAEIAHIALKSSAVGTRPKVGLLLGEIFATPQVPFDILDITSADPPTLPPSETLYSDRYTALQNGTCPKCEHFQLRIQYASEDAANELKSHTIYGAKHAERKQQ